MTAIVTDNLTTGALDGTGVFDELMVSVKAHLAEEFDNNRITGSDYAKAYAGALDSVLQQSIAFLLQKDVADKQADLIAAQIIKTNNEAAQVLVVSTKVSGVDSTLVTAQTNKENAEKLLTDAQELRVDAETSLLGSQRSNEITQNTVIIKQALKVAEETALLSAKEKTEIAQTQDNYSSPSSTAVSGIVGKQKSLYAKQTDGFDRDAEQKMAKIASDMWTVAASIEGSGSFTWPSGTGTNEAFDQDEVGKILNKGKTGIQA
jgi:hypothetical protein